MLWDFGRVFFFQQYLCRTGWYALMHQSRTGEAIRQAGLCRDWLCCLFLWSISGEPCGRRQRSWGTGRPSQPPPCSTHQPQESTATSGDSSKHGKPSPGRQTSTTSRCFTGTETGSARWGQPLQTSQLLVCVFTNGFKYLLSSLHMSLHASWPPPPSHWLPPDILSNSCSPSPSLPH